MFTREELNEKVQNNPSLVMDYLMDKQDYIDWVDSRQSANKLEQTQIALEEARAKVAQLESEVATLSASQVEELIN